MTLCFNPNHKYGPTDAPAVRYCPTCDAQGKRVAMEYIERGERPPVYVCPVARSEVLIISDERRQSVRAMVAERVGGVPF